MSNKQPTIIAAGDDILEDTLLSLYIIEQAKSKKPKICLLPTPTGDHPQAIKYWFNAFDKYNCDLDYLPLFFNKEENHREFLLNQDIILVSGGHSKSAMGVWKEWGIDKILYEAYQKGIILAGGSAGSVCWFQSAITDSFGSDLKPMNCLDFLPFSHCPHYTSKARRIAYADNIANGTISDGYAVDDGAALHFVDGKLHRVISSREEASAYHVYQETSGGKVKQEKLIPEYLGCEENFHKYLSMSLFKVAVEEQDELIEIDQNVESNVSENSTIQLGYNL